MKFRFPLQKALDWTEVEESAMRLEIARLLKEAEALAARRRELEANLEALLGPDDRRLSLEWAPYVAGKVPSDAGEIRNVDKQAKAKQSEIGIKKAELNRLLLKRKGLESLKGKRLRDFRMSEGRRDQKRLDDNYQILKLRVKNG
jgi:hypothetical protein